VGVIGISALLGCRTHIGTVTDRKPFSFAIDSAVVPSNSSLVAAVDEEGHKFEYAPDQLVVHPKDQAALLAFLARYHGTVLVDRSIPKTLERKTMPATGFSLVRVDPSASPIDDLEVNAQRTNIKGTIRFSSEAAARLAALVVRERSTIEIGVNLVLRTNDFWKTKNVFEHPDGVGGFIDFASMPYMQLANVVQAWDYLEYKGIPFGPVPWQPPVIAIIDGGFAIDGSGVPIGQNPDFDMSRIRQLDETDHTTRGHNAGGKNPWFCTLGDPCPWHGTKVFSVAAAVPFNRFGAAGTSGLVAKLILIKVSVLFTFEVAEAISDAALMEPPADVINVSSGVGDFCASQFCGYIASTGFTDFQAHVNFARGYSLATVVASAGNESESNEDQYYNPPCTLNGVLCVGATHWDGTSQDHSGRGSRVRIWAPDCIDVTPVPVNDTTLAPTLTVFCGTSAAAPFVSGIVALMKALEPTNLHAGTGLDVDRVASILQATATGSTDPIVRPGVVNALAALQAIRPNQPPTIQITSHRDGQNVVINSTQNFIATISDPELAPGHIEGMTTTWVDSLQGPLCSSNNCNGRLSTIGPHQIIATVTDGWGAKASQTITLNVIAGPRPFAGISWPPDSATFFASQQIELRGSGSSTADGTIPDNRLAWTSDRDGPLGTGHDLLTKLSVNTHRITLTATDSLNRLGTASISVRVVPGNDVPTAQILNPADASFFDVNEAFALVGKGTDPIDGDLPDASLTWSDINGVLGTGKTLTVRIPAPPCGPMVDTITLTVRNQAGRTGQTSIRVYIGKVC
jgi:hypothetical protein